MAASVQERLKLKRITLDTWSTKEKLALASSVHRSGDQNWSYVSRNIRTFAESNRPPDWFSQKNCAQQYATLLETVETPKRKKRSAGSTDKTEVETMSEIIVKKLTSDRIDELKKVMTETQAEYLKLLDEVNAIAAGEYDNRISQLLQELEDENLKKEQEKEAHIKWLKDREERKIALEKAWKPGTHLSSIRRTPSLSDPSSDADSPLSEPLNVDVPEEITTTKPTPTSPLLTSLLKSPASSSNTSSSILHSVITSPLRGVSPTIANLLNSPVNLPNSMVMPPNNPSPNLKNLVSNALGGYQVDEQKPPLPQTPSQGAPTLSMLLELPPSMPGKPLPMLQPPAPPPYSEHLGPPPPYSMATEYLQKQKAEAAQAQLVSQRIKMPETTSLLPATSLIASPVKIELPNLEESEVELSEISGDKEISSAPLNASDHDYLNKMTGSKESEENASSKEPTISNTVTPEKIAPIEVSAADNKDIKATKKAELDVFEFDEKKEACGDVDDLSYLKSNSHRLVKKDSDVSLRAEITRKSTETLLVEEDDSKPIWKRLTNIVPEETTEKPVDSKSEKDEEENAILEEDTVEESKVESRRDSVKSEIAPFEEDIAKKIKTELESAVNKIDPEEPDQSKGDDIMPINTSQDFSTTEDEKSNEAPPRSAGPKRRGTSLSVYDSVPNSPASFTEEEKEYKAWKKAVLLVLTRMMGHKSASLFLKPITDDQAPGYSTSVLRPMDLSSLKKNIESGGIRTTEEFQRDVMLMFFNATMFNRPGSVVYQMTIDMKKDSMEHIQMLLQATGDNQPSRRETRTQDKVMGSGGKTRILRHSTKMELKRKRASSDSGRKKIKVEDNGNK